MGDCIFCGKPAGVFRSKHRECKETHAAGEQQILKLIVDAASSTSLLDTLCGRVKDIASHSYMRDDEQRALAIQGVSSAVDASLQENVISQDQEIRLLAVRDALSLTSNDLQQSGAWGKIAKSTVIRDLLNGSLPKPYSLPDNISPNDLPMNLQKGEQIIWLFGNVRYLEDKVRRQYVGRSSGISIRVAKGVYYRSGAFRGQPIDHTERVLVDKGILAVTNKHIYFAGPSKALRIAYQKIVSFIPFNDGVGVIRDAINAKPQIFVTNDGWFTYNLVTNLAHL